MASKAFLIAVIAAIAFAVPASAAYNYTVGDDAGWKLGVNYTQWAEGKDFRVGDKLVFMYNKDAHNLAKVSGDDFKQCVASNKSNILSSGNEEITLSAPGKKWYICSVADHCSKGMKLVITVSAADGPAPPPATPPPSTSAAGEVSPSLKSYVWILGALAAFKLFMVDDQ
ncbi:Lamin-like protein [Sesamum alatum]|uniref:Lamin-like protein n=1 Tax=Sesamum alatum TaxID=300844 RepID=A0AAE1YS58_9LAMI|nr:Lamin-like protein [Sesamum alatum]